MTSAAWLMQDLTVWHTSVRLPAASLQVVRQTYDKEQDTFRYAFLIAPCLLLALVVNHKFTVTEVLNHSGGMGRPLSPTCAACWWRT